MERDCFAPCRNSWESVRITRVWKGMQTMQTQTELTQQAFLASKAYLSDREVGDRYGVSRQTPWTWIKRDETFPKPLSLSRGCTRWRLADLEAWEKQKSASQ